MHLNLKVNFRVWYFVMSWIMKNIPPFLLFFENLEEDEEYIE